MNLVCFLDWETCGLFHGLITMVKIVVLFLMNNIIIHNNLKMRYENCILNFCILKFGYF